MEEPRTLTFDESRQLLSISETPADQRTVEQHEIWSVYQARSKWENEQRLQRIEAKALQTEQSRKAEADYHRLIMAAEPPRDSLQYFIQQLGQRSIPISRLTLADSPETLAQYLTAAYKAEVSRTGGTASLDDMTLRSIADAARWLSQGTKSGLILRGNVGTGKTTLLNAIRKTIAIRTGESLQVWEARRIAPLAKGAEGQKVLEEIAKRPLLGIDDLGVESVSVKDYGNEAMPVVDLLTERYSARRFTIITTNLSSEEIAQRYGERIADRIREQYNVMTYDGNQKSYRK